MFPGRLHQGHLDPGPEPSGEGPPGAVPLTLPHKPRSVVTGGPESRGRSGSKPSRPSARNPHSPLHQVPKISKDNVTDGAEVLSCLIGAELHEDDLFASDFRRAPDHQGSFLRSGTKLTQSAEFVRVLFLENPDLSFGGKGPDVGDLRHHAVDFLRLSWVHQGDVIVVVVTAAQQPSVPGKQGDSCERPQRRMLSEPTELFSHLRGSSPTDPGSVCAVRTDLVEGTSPPPGR